MKRGLTSPTGCRNPTRIAGPLIFGLLLRGLPASWKTTTDNVTAQTPSGQRGLDQRRLVSALSKMPASFEPNWGQADPSVKFLSRGPGYALFLMPGEAVLSLLGPRAHPLESSSGQAYRALRLEMLNSSLSTKIEGQNLLPHRSNYFLGNRPGQPQVGVSNFSRVRYRSVYPGIDMVFHGDPTQLEFDLDVAPGADVHHVRLRLEGAESIQLDTSGDLIARVDSAELRLHRPVTYQHTSRGDRMVPGKFTLSANQEIGFRVDNYDGSLPLVIDPVLSYSTFFGGTGADQALAVAVDSQGDFYVAGQTASSNFPVASAFQSTYGGFTDAFVAKFRADGTGLAYSTFLGGSFVDVAQAIAVDSQGNAYVTGFTTSTDFPTKNPLQATLNGSFGQDVFITKLSPDGSSLVFSTYLGGSGLDTAAAIALDSQNEVVLAGTTKSTDFPLVNALETSLHGTSGNSDAFVAKIKADGSALVFSTYLGGAGVDGATGVAVDSQGNIVVSGGTNSTDFPTQNALQPNFGGGTTTDMISADAFLTKLKGDGSAILFSTYWGGSNSDQGAYLSLDSSDNIFLVGETNSADFPTSNQTKPPGAAITGFVTKFPPDGSSVLFSTIFGGTGTDFIYGSAVDPAGNICISGNTSSVDFPLANPLQTTYGGGSTDGFVSELSSNGSMLLFSTYLGGGNTDGFYRMAADGNGIYVVGSTSSADFPTAGVQVNGFMGSTDGVVVKINSASSASFSPSSLTFGIQSVGTTSAPQTVTLTNTGSATLSVEGISITGANAGDFAQTNTCGSSVAAGDTCGVEVTFKPTGSGPRKTSISVGDSAGTGTQTIVLTGVGAALNVSPGTVPFGNQNVGTASAPQGVTLTNQGSATIHLWQIAISGTNAGDFSQTTTCGGILGAGLSCTVSVTFRPSATGARTASVLFSNDGGGSPQAVSLTGTGTAAASLTLSTSALFFSAQFLGEESAAQSVELTNSGNVSLTLGRIMVAGSSQEFLETNGCHSVLAPAARCTVKVVFRPLRPGRRAAKLMLPHNGVGPGSIALSGVGASSVHPLGMPRI